MARLTPGFFSVDHLDTYPGFVPVADQDDDLDGLVRPLFTLDTAQRIAADWIAFEGLPDEPPSQAFYEPDDDAFHLFEPAVREWHVMVGQPYGPLKLYAIGRDLWTWHRSAKTR